MYRELIDDTIFGFIMTLIGVYILRLILPFPGLNYWQTFVIMFPVAFFCRHLSTGFDIFRR